MFQPKPTPGRSEDRVPFLDLRAQYAALRDEIRAALEEVLATQQFVLGPQGEAFEREIAAFCDVSHAVGVANGTDALTLALAACGVGAGDEVIVPAFSFIATATAVVRLGATPVFADIDPETLNLAPNEIERHRTAKTKAVMPVHLCGMPADMYPIGEIAARYGLQVIEDNAQAIGARYRGQRTGSFGAAAGISFYPTKNLGGYGDGGMLVTNSEEIAAHVRRLRDHGQSARYVSTELGWNSRLDEIQAAVLRVKFRRLDDWTVARQKHAARYSKSLAGIDGLALPIPPAHIEHVYHLYTVKIQGGSARRDRIKQKLAERGIATAVYYALPLPGQPAYRDLGWRSGDFPGAESACQQVLSLPMFAELKDTQIDRVAGELKACLKETD
jgi:dTDP-4-amino-4,6-dideoxygalactose transaminase